MNNSQPPTLPPINPTSNSTDNAKANNAKANNSATNNGGGVQLCASCDRCRSRKTKCDGARPCLNCKNRYLRVNKLSMDDLR